MQATIHKAFQNGLSRIELAVYTTNTPVIALYRRFSFVEEGIKRMARFLDGRFAALPMMALLNSVK